ncbi:MAG: hypothetical protein Pars93KO_28590 [Parasphingorhabdus sp.]
MTGKKNVTELHETAKRTGPPPQKKKKKKKVIILDLKKGVQANGKGCFFSSL